MHYARDQERKVFLDLYRKVEGWYYDTIEDDALPETNFRMVGITYKIIRGKFPKENEGPSIWDLEGHGYLQAYNMLLENHMYIKHI